MQEKTVGMYLSDISGAFDRVSREKLLDKLKAGGVNNDFMRFLGSYLDTRRSTILVGGAKSQTFTLTNSVYQGTVLGPRLWNVYFQDVSAAIPDDYQEKNR